MSAALHYSITAILPSDTTVTEQEALLLRFARSRPGIVFHDVLQTADGAVPVRVEGIDGGRVVRLSALDAPAHVGTSVTRCRRDLMEDFVDVGDVLLPCWGAQDSSFELSIGDVERCVADLEDMAKWVAAAIEEKDEEDDVDPEDLEFLKVVTTALEIARSERLPLVASW